MQIFSSHAHSSQLDDMPCYYSACDKKSHQSKSGKILIYIQQNDHEYGSITVLKDGAVKMSSTVKKKMAVKYPPVSSSAREI